MMNSKANKRIGITMIILLLALVILIIHFSYSFLYLPSHNAQKIREKRMYSFQSLPKSAQEGNYYDTNGHLLMEHGKANSSEAYSMAWLLGYYASDNNHEYKMGLRGNLVDYSYLHLNKQKVGASTFLTIDSNLQNLAYELLHNQEGSITVLDAKTGAIRALASHSTFDFNINDLSTLTKQTAKNSQFTRGLFEKDPPGSTFKIITSISALEQENIPNLNFKDTGSYLSKDGGTKIVNFENKAYGNVGLEKALNHSINTYFAHLGEELGPTALEKTAQKFLIGQDIPIPYLSTLHSKLDVQGANELAATAYGQGKTQITPVHLALIAQSLANKGIMKEAYIVESIQSDQNILYKHQEKDLSKVTESAVIEKLNPYLRSTAKLYGLKGEVYAKTGTAELPDKTTHIYLLAYTKDYGICLSLNHKNQSNRLIPLANRLLQYLQK
ncbi:penicillin-binding transpeptidase domain-containing protein [Bulleidia sp. zg-1006]|uniref:penicillin-binding transpeptidase domain-containing protein n=1 Tax=Bulleidia sp. zg-1006 TaxID=2806552 RepID=UPI00193ADDE1|nr:penicillin-binding transpeptidase domain-containing protein [Bulleidia sp. zg-1006]QRG87077.1 hypothetical protein JOS54_01860 [Bulleidia sp. zg-1006]